jgi:putative oxidoreductase
MDASTRQVRAVAPAPAPPLERFVPYALTLLRIFAALMFLEHGASKFFGFPAPFPRLDLFSIEWFAACIELVGGALLALGLFTRLAALIMSGEMAIGYFMVHAPHSFYPYVNHGEIAVLYCFVFFYFIFAGGGSLSLDALLWRKTSQSPRRR